MTVLNTFGGYDIECFSAHKVSEEFASHVGCASGTPEWTAHCQ